MRELIDASWMDGWMHECMHAWILVSFFCLSIMFHFVRNILLLTGPKSFWGPCPCSDQKDNIRLGTIQHHIHIQATTTTITTTIAHLSSQGGDVVFYIDLKQQQQNISCI
mmetsp:Transcript_2170/g.3798  ORF Transcript_2170/g.3798 Transcript_2170/m.3798 type:complete len:110 (+) Transcript_2170:264-593(+)